MNFLPDCSFAGLAHAEPRGQANGSRRVGAEFIGYNRRRREALLLQEFPHQPNCRPSVPAGLNQEIQDFALTVHGTPEIELPPSNYDDHLVQVPAFGRSWPPTLNPPRIGPTEFQDPSSNCLIRDVETTLGKQVLNVPIAQRETAIEPDGMLDDDRWKAVTTVGYLAHPETLKHRPCRSHAVNVTMPARCMRAYVKVHCKPKTEKLYRTAIDRHIVPALGTMAVKDVHSKDVIALHDRLRNTPSMANHVVAMLSKMFKLAETWDLVPRGRNPCKAVSHYREQPRERFLTPEEYRNVGAALREAEAGGWMWPPAIAAIRLLMLTGCRKSEILTLRWEHVDLETGELRLPDTKTGAKVVYLGDPAIAVLRGIDREDDNAWVIAGRKPGSHLTDLQQPWRRIRARAGLDDVRIHDLRHSFASGGLLVGEGLPMIGKLLGHTQVQTTARYAHLANDPVKSAANRIASRIAKVAG